MSTEKHNAKYYENALKPGMYGDGKGLWLRVSTPERRSWVYRYMLHGKAHEMGLGSILEVPLGEARKRAADARLLKTAGVDPLQAKNARKAAARAVVTFAKAAKDCHESLRPGWRSEKHAAQWWNTVDSYVLPTLGKTDVSSVDTPAVLKCLAPIWHTKHETATRTRGRIEAVLDYAKAHGLRTGDNPATDSVIKHALAKPAAVTKQHHGAMPYRDVPAFFNSLGDAPVARTLKFTILTASRTGEVVGARWEEIDADCVWIIPASRMKNGRPHTVPLAPAALSLFGKRKATGLVFGIGTNSMIKAVKRTHPELTVHGFRSAFADWAAEATDAAREIREACLAHTVGSAVERAYRRSTFLDKHRELLTAWAAYCTGATY